MSGERYITHRQFNTIIYSHQGPFYSHHDILETVDKAVMESGGYSESAGRVHGFDRLCDVSDEEFEEICDRIPIEIDKLGIFDLCDLMDDSGWISPTGERKCAFFRHINALNAQEHEHTFFEFCYVWKGTLIQIYQDTFYNVMEGDFIITPPGMRHTVRTQTRDSIIFNILISKKMFRNILFESLSAGHSLSRFLRKCMSGEEVKRPYIFHFDRDSEAERESLKNMFRLAALEFYGGYSNPLIIDGFICQIFGTVMNVDDKMHSENDYFIDILDCINSNYKSITLGDLSKRFGYNETYLSRLIKRMTGKNFSELVRSMRISYAESLMISTGMSVKEIGERTGYYDYAGFARAFEKEKGIKPSEYRDLYPVETM